MALFKISKGLKSALPTTYNEGYCYFTTDDGKFYIDTTNTAAGRICLNAAKADKVANSLSVNNKTFDGSSAIDVGTIEIAYGGTGATTAAAALANLGAAAASHTHSYLPLSGGTVTGNTTFQADLLVSNSKSAGGYVKFWEDNEGGNIAIGSKSGKEFQMDAYDDNTWRVFAYNDSGTYKAIRFSRTTGDFKVDGALYCSSGKTVYHTGNIVYSSTQPTGSSGMIWLKPV